MMDTCCLVSAGPRGRSCWQFNVRPSNICQFISCYFAVKQTLLCAGYCRQLTAPSGEEVGLHRSIGIVERCEIDSVPSSNCLHLLNPLRSNESSSLRERFKPAVQSKSHAFEETSMNHIREGMPIQNSVEIRRERYSAGNLSQTSEEDFDARHLRVWRQVLGVARIGHNCIRGDPAQQTRGGRQTRSADYD